MNSHLVFEKQELGAAVGYEKSRSCREGLDRVLQVGVRIRIRSESCSESFDLGLI